MKLNNETIRTAVKEWLENSKEAEEKYGHISNWDVSNVTEMSGLFFGADFFNEDIGSWDVSNVTNMSMMFMEAMSFNQDIGKWDVNNVTDMNEMFYGAESFNKDIDDWDVRNAIYMSEMFFLSGHIKKYSKKWDNRWIRTNRKLSKEILQSLKSNSENDLVNFSLEHKNYKSEILSLLEKEKINSLYFNFYWVEPNREFELVEGCCSIDDFDLIDETYNKIPNESFENWQIMTLAKQEKLLDILCNIDHPYDNSQQDCHCTLELKNDKLTYKIEEDFDNGYFNHETGEWDEGNEDDAFCTLWKITDEGIFNIIK